MKTLIRLFSVAIMLSATLPAVSIAAEAQAEAEPWWRTAVFYEVFVRSFYDSREGDLAGDGIGDIPGLIEKLDYLNDGDPETTSDLGVTALWLMPIKESPSYHGYDVVDYFNVDQEYGTNEDFKRLMKEAHKRGIKIIIDFVINHASKRHPYFLNSSSPEQSHYDWFIWDVEPRNGSGPWGQPVWHHLNDEYYYGLFWSGMPDWKLTNPKVTEEMFNVTDFWIKEMGVDGFRLDAIRYFIETKESLEDTPGTHAWLKNFHTYLKKLNPNALSVGEVWAGNDIIGSYADGQIDLAFQFGLANSILSTANFGLNRYVKQDFKDLHKYFEQGHYATFLTNHDQRRAMLEVAEDVERAKMAAKLLLSLPGVPFIYYGEEIGMVGDKPDEDIRTPLQWGDGKYADFSTHRPWRVVNNDYKSKNIADQQSDPNSLWNVYREFIELRKTHPEISLGDIEWVSASSPKVMSFIRSYQGESLVYVINLQDRLLKQAKLFTKTKWNLKKPIYTEGGHPVVEADDNELLLKELPPHYFSIYRLE